MLGSIAYGIWLYQPFAATVPTIPIPAFGIFLLRMALNIITELLTGTERQRQPPYIHVKSAWWCRIRLSMPFRI